MRRLHIVNEPNILDILNNAYKFNNTIKLLKKMISFLYKYRCQICFIDLKGYPYERNIDHIIPKSLIAISEFWNLQLLCSSCNREKGNSLLYDWVEMCHNAVKTMYVPPAHIKTHRVAFFTIFISRAPEMELELKKLYKDAELNERYGGYEKPLIKILRNMVLSEDFKSKNFYDYFVNAIDKLESKEKYKKNNEPIIKFLVKSANQLRYI